MQADILRQLGARDGHSRIVDGELRVVLVVGQTRVGLWVRSAEGAVHVTAELPPATTGEILALQARLPSGVTLERLDRWIHAMAAEAAAMKRRVARPLGGAEMFDVYRD